MKQQQEAVPIYSRPSRNPQRSPVPQTSRKFTRRNLDKGFLGTVLQHIQQMQPAQRPHPPPTNLRNAVARRDRLIAKVHTLYTFLDSTLRIFDDSIARRLRAAAWLVMKKQKIRGMRNASIRILGLAVAIANILERLGIEIDIPHLTVSLSDNAQTVIALLNGQDVNVWPVLLAILLRLNEEQISALHAKLQSTSNTKRFLCNELCKNKNK